MTLIIFVMCVYVKLYIIYRVIYNIYIYTGRGLLRLQQQDTGVVAFDFA